MFWTGILPHDVPVQDILGFNEYVEEIFEEQHELIQTAVANGVAEAIDNIDFK